MYILFFCIIHVKELRCPSGVQFQFNLRAAYHYILFSEEASCFQMICKKTAILMLLQLNHLHWHQLSWMEAHHRTLKITAVTDISQTRPLKRVYLMSLTNIPLTRRKLSSVKMGHPFMNHHQTTPWNINICNFQ